MGTSRRSASTATGLGTAAGNAAATAGMGTAAVLGTAGTEESIFIIETIAANAVNNFVDWPWRACLLAIW